jgi:hypothetical protein
MTNPVNTFIDGFVAQATTAILPTKTASVDGVIRNINTGEPITNTAVSFDMTGIATAGGSTLAGPNGNVSFQTMNYRATTDANGKFVISGLPADSNFNVYVAGYNNAGQVAAPPVANLAATVTTQEDEMVNMGNVFVTPIVANDVIPPTVLSTLAYSGVPQMAGQCPGTLVGGIGATGASLTPVATMPELRDGVDGSSANPIVINFSEQMVAGDVSKVYVRQWIPGGAQPATSVDIDVTSMTMGADKKSVSLVLAAPYLPVGPTRFDVMFIRDGWTDIAGNQLDVTTDALNATPPRATATTAPYDALGPNTATVVLEMCTFKDVNAGTPGTLAQSVGGEAAEDQTNDFIGFITDHSQNLDASDLYIPTSGPRVGQNINAAMDRLDELEDARGGAANNHDSNTANLTFTAGDAPQYAITIIRTAQGIINFNAVPNNNITIFDNLQNQLGGALSSGATLPLLTDGIIYSINVTNVIPGDTVSIQPTDAFNYPIGAPASVVLVDNTRPTTVLQHAYRDDNAGTSAPAVVNTTGDGAELSWAGQTAAIGIPLLPITPHLIDILSGAGANIITTAGARADRSLRHELMARSLGTGMANDVYDTTAFNAMVNAGLSRTIGVAFSEDIVISGDPSESTAAGFNGCVAQNDTVVRVNQGLAGSVSEDNDVNNNGATDPGEVDLNANGVIDTTNENLDEADLVRCTTSNVLTLANTDNGKTINFNGKVADVDGNTTTANSNAQVVVRDDMPPILTFAAFDGQVLNLRFNERVSIANSPVLTFIDPTGTNQNVPLTLTNANTIIDPTGMNLSVTPATAALAGNILLNMVDVPNTNAAAPYVYVENSAYYDQANYTNARAPQANTLLGHAILDYRRVRDANGRSWIDWINSDPVGAYADDGTTDPLSDLADTADIDRRVEFQNPRFAAVDALGRFESSITVDGYATSQVGAATNSTNTDQVVVISFSHPVKWDGFGNSGDGLNPDNSTANGSPTITLSELNAFYQIGGGPAAGQRFIANGTPAANDEIVVSNGGRTLTLTFRTSQAVTSLANGTLRLVDTAGAQKFFTSALITADRDGGASASTTNPGADGVFDPQAVYSDGTSISPKQ